MWYSKFYSCVRVCDKQSCHGIIFFLLMGKCQMTGTTVHVGCEGRVVGHLPLIGQ